MAGGTNAAVGTGAATGAASGAAMGGMVGGPWGALIGGGIGLATGALSGSAQAKSNKAQQEALAAQQAATRAEMERRAQGVAATRETFGDLWSFKDLGAGPGSWRSGNSGGMGDKDKKALGMLIGGATGGVGPAFFPGVIGGNLGGAGGMFGKKGKGKVITPYDTRRQDSSYWQNLNKTITRHGELAGGIEQQAGAVRDAGQVNLTGNAQQAAVANRGSIASRGLMGSSLADSAKQGLLAQYAGGRANVAQAAENTRQSGWDALANRQQQMEALAQGGGNLSNTMAAQQGASAIAGARQQIPYATFGNLLNTGMGIFQQGAMAEAKGGAGFGALGLPDVGVRGKQNAATGGQTSGRT